MDYDWEYTLNLTNLNPETLYYVKAFVIVWAGTVDLPVVYGNEVTFTTRQ